MEYSFITFNNILFDSLRPWKLSNETDLKFKQMLAETTKEYYAVQPLYEVRFLNPISNFRKYFIQLIDNEAICFLNYIHTEVEAASTKNEKTYITHFALTRVLAQVLKDTNNVLTIRNYTLEQYNSNKKLTIETLAVSNESYVLHYLKFQLVRLVKEIQDSFSDFLKETPLSDDEIFFNFFNEPAPPDTYIVKAENYPNTKPSISSFSKQEKVPFNAIQNDIRNEKKGVLSYSQIIKNPSRFAKIEEELFSNGYIDENYNFTDKHGQKQYLAAFYHQLIAKKYFNDRIFPGNTANSPLQIRKFLDHRYNADVDKQFRNWTNDKQALADFIEKDYWLDHILAC
jgi:hypothetical protein